MDDYADAYLGYDAGGRVSTAVTQGAGCSSCTGGLGESTFTAVTSPFADGYNLWRTRSAETLPDGTQRIVYSNYAGQVMLDVTKVGGSSWATFYKYDSNGRLVLQAEPSAVSGYDETKSDLLDNQSGNYSYLRDAEGLVSTLSYGSSTTATSSTAGDVSGYLKQTAIQRGETGTSVLQSSQAYLSRTAGSVTIYVTANLTRYRNDNGTGGLSGDR